MQFLDSARNVILSSHVLSLFHNLYQSVQSRKKLVVRFFRSHFSQTMAQKNYTRLKTATLIAKHLQFKRTLE